MRTKLFHLEQEQSKEQVRVTVGGQVFQASRATLTEGDAAHSMLGALYSGRWEHEMTSAGASNSKVSSEGGVSIDRSPVLFTYVLQWLRSGSAECLPDSADLRRGLLREAEYYILPGLVDILKGWRQRSLSLSAENQEILQAENIIRAKLSAAPDSARAFNDPDAVPPDVRSLQALADSLMIDIFGERESFVLDLAPPKDSEHLMILVDKRAAADSWVRAAISQLDVESRLERLSKQRHTRGALEEMEKLEAPKNIPSVCASLSMFRDCTFTYFTMDTLHGLDWTGVFVAGGAVLGALLPLPSDLQCSCFPRGIDPDKGIWSREQIRGDTVAEELIQHYHQAKCHERVNYKQLWDADDTFYSDNTVHTRVKGPTTDKGEVSKFTSSDIDIFLYGLSKEQAERKIEHILAVLGTTVKHVIRSEHCISFIRGWPHRNVQVNLRVLFPSFSF
jgi:hypothetical protein